MVLLIENKVVVARTLFLHETILNYITGIGQLILCLLRACSCVRVAACGCVWLLVAVCSCVCETRAALVGAACAACSCV